MMNVKAVALAVRDLDRVAAFYQRVIGLSVVEAGPGRALLGVGNAGLLELLGRPDALPVDPAAAGLFHTAFLLPRRADLGRWLTHAAALGQRLDGAADHLVSEAVYLRDPEGNGIEVYADRAPDSWQWTETPAGRRVAMANTRLDQTGLLALADRPWDGAPPGIRIGHVHLQVGDVQAATTFYTAVPGLDVTLDWPDAVFLSSGGYHHHLAANRWNSAGAGPRDPRRAGLHSVTFEGAARADAVDPWGNVFHFHS